MQKSIKIWLLVLVASIGSIVLIETFSEDANCTDLVENVKELSRKNGGGSFGNSIIEITNIQQFPGLRPRKIELPGQVLFGCTATAYISSGTKQPIRYFRAKNGNDFYTGIEVGD